MTAHQYVDFHRAGRVRLNADGLHTEEDYKVSICDKALIELGLGETEDYTIRAIPCEKSRAQSFPVHVWLQWEDDEDEGWWDLYGPVRFCDDGVQAEITSFGDEAVEAMLGYLPNKNDKIWFRLEVIKDAQDSSRD